MGVLGKRSAVEDDPDVPKAFVRVDIATKSGRRKSTHRFKFDEIRPTIDKAVAWQKNNAYPTLGNKAGTTTYRYSEETLREFSGKCSTAKARTKVRPGTTRVWQKLRKLQDKNGAWGTSTMTTVHGDLHSFSILYLIRSTQKETIAKLNEGFTIGGYGLPKNSASIKRVGDKIVSEETASVEGLAGNDGEDGTENVEVGLLPRILRSPRIHPERKVKCRVCRVCCVVKIGKSRRYRGQNSWDAVKTSIKFPIHLLR